jgi:DNA-binding response OmpR family regulator
MNDLAAILLVDDDHDFCESVASYFEDHGLAVLTATDARLLKNINLNALRVILLDIDMPKVSGFDALEIIRRQNDQVTTIMVSGHSDLTTRLSCLDQGADFFMAKPVDLAELFLVVQRIVGQQDIKAKNGSMAYWRMSRSRHVLITPDGDEHGLSTGEFRVFELLLSNSPELVSKEELTEAATGRIDLAKTYSRALEVLVSRVRSRVNANDVKLPVKALRNAGYVFHGVGEVVD